MKPSEALDRHRLAVRQLIASQTRLRNLRVFGSVARQEDRDGGDIDFVVDASPEASLLDLGELQFRLQELLGVRVDLLTPAELPARARDRLLQEARPV